LNPRYEYLEYRRTNIDSQRDAGFKLHKVRKLVKDKEWEDMQYLNFVAGHENHPTAHERVLSDFKWEVREIAKNAGTREARVVPVIDLIFDGYELEPEGELGTNKIELSDDVAAQDAIDKIRSNTLRIITRCRKEFDMAWDSLSIINYLEETWSGETQDNSPEAFANELLDRCEVLLRLPSEGPAPFRLAYLMAPSHSSGHSSWLERVLNHLRDTTHADMGFSTVVHHSDKTALTYITVADLVDIDKLPAYREGIDQYLRWPLFDESTQMSRVLRHVYPAEQNVVQFDKILSSGEIKLLPPQITALLDDEGKLERFALAIALNLIQDHKVIDDTTFVGNVKRISIEPREGEVDIFMRPVTAPYVWWLNRPEEVVDRNVTYLEAAETFCLRSGAQSPGDHSLEEMYERLVEVINQEMELILKDKYLPKWSEGEGNALGIEAAKMPEGRMREVNLHAATRVSLYQSLLADFELYLDQLKSGEIQNISLDSETAFIELMMDELITWINLNIRRVE
jgi:hypothetical protein